MNSSLLLSFVIGSSFLVVFSHWFGLRYFLKDGTAYKDETPKFKFDIFSKLHAVSHLIAGANV